MQLQALGAPPLSCSQRTDGSSEPIIDAARLAFLQTKIGKGVFECLDVSEPTAIKAAVEQFSFVTGGQLDMLFANAGIDAKGQFSEMEWSRIERLVSVNLLGVMALIQDGDPLLSRTEGSLCLSTASASAIVGVPGMAVYSATKHAIKGLTEALSVEFASAGVRAADLVPGTIDTGMLTAGDKAMLPKEGMWRPLSARSVAEAAWAAYTGKKLHIYVPHELTDLVQEVALAPETIRDRRVAGQPF